MENQHTEAKGVEDLKPYDLINPDHYKNKSIETIDKMVKIWGHKAVAEYCEITAFKYRERIGLKPGQDLYTEHQKILWYENKSKELLNQHALKMEQVEKLQKQLQAKTPTSKKKK